MTRPTPVQAQHPAALEDLAFRNVAIEEVAVPTAEFGTLTGVAAGGGNAVLLMLHGIGGNAHGWSTQLHDFGRRFRVIAWNAPGYLGSTAMRMPNPTLKDYADAVIAFLDGLGISSPIGVLGHSMGGLIASRVAASHPERISRMVLAGCSSGHRSYEQAQRDKILKARLAFGTDGDPLAYARGRAPGLLSNDPAVETIARAVAVLSRLRQPGFSHATHMVSEADIFEHAARIAIPTRVICGTEDRVTPEALNRRIAAAINGAHYVSLPSTGHWSFLETPDAFNHAVLEFLA